MSPISDPGADAWAPFRLGGAPPAEVVWRDDVYDALRSFHRALGHPRPLPAAGEPVVPVITAHQPVLFGGPLFLWAKALAVSAEAERLRAQGVPAVPVFWVAGCDHDRDEVAALNVWAPGQEAPQRWSLAERLAPLCSVGPQAADVADLIDRLREAFPGDRAGALLDTLRGAYAGQSFTHGFARWLVAAMGERAPLFVDATHPAIRRAGHALVRAMIDEPAPWLERATQRAAWLADRDQRAPVKVTPDALPFFVTDGDGARRRVHHREGRFALRGTETWLERSALFDLPPARFSPSCLLRPLVQEEALGPGVCILGPTELAYHAQTAAWYEPLLGQGAASSLCARPEVCVFARRDAERLSNASIDLEDAAAGRLIKAATTSSAVDRLDETQPIRDALGTYLRAATADLPGLAPAVDKLRQRVERALETFEARRTAMQNERAEQTTKAVQSVLARARPGGRPQERAVSGLSFYLRHGEAMVDALMRHLRADHGRRAVVL